MSIIYEALKKTEGNPPDSLSGQDNHQRKFNPKKIILIILIIIFFTAVFILFYNFSKFKEIIFSGFASEQSKTTGSLKQEVGPAGEGNLYNSVETTAKKSELKQPGFSPRLEGIIFDTNKPFAIINGRRLYQGDKGDKISDFTVSKIKINSVELADSGSDRVKVLSISF